MRISIVLTGYYFKYLELYQKINDESKLYNDYQFSLYILSHKSKEEISDELLTYLNKNNWQIIYQPNIGWDWGCHAQFMQWHSENKKIEPDYILFLHDDISITKNGFINSFLNKTKQGYELIGNSAPFTIIRGFEKNYSDEAFILQKNEFEYESGKIEIVRGSALFLSFNLAKQVLLFLPYQKCGDINLANRSLRMFGAITTKLVGKNKIGYLSNENFKSNFITEEMRGGDIGNNFFLKRFIQSNLTKMFLLSDRIFISTLILRHSYPLEVGNKLKINFTENDIKQGYLNICANNNFCSDIEMNDFERLLSEGRIYRILISNQIAYDNTELFKTLLEKIAESVNPVDVFIASDKIKKATIKQFCQQHKHLKIKIEKIPTKRIMSWVNRLYIKFPQNS